MAEDDVDSANDQQHAQSPDIRSNSVSQLFQILKDRDNPLRSYFLGVFLGGGTMATTEKSRFGLAFLSTSCIELYQFLTSYGVALPKLRIRADYKSVSSYGAAYAAHVTWKSTSKKLVKILDGIVSNWSKRALRPRDRSKRRLGFALFMLGFIWPAGRVLSQYIKVRKEFCIRGVDIDTDRAMSRYIRSELAKLGINNIHIKKHRDLQRSVVVDGSTDFKQLLQDGLLELERLRMPLPGKLQLLNMSLIHKGLPYDVMSSSIFTSFFEYLGEQGHMDAVFGVIAQDLISLNLYQLNIILEAIGHKTIQTTADVDLVPFVKWTFNHMRKLPGMTPYQDLFALYTKICLERQAIEEENTLEDVPASVLLSGSVYDDAGVLYSDKWIL